MKRILSIQDISCVGQCSLTVALPIISAFGVETAILPSAVLSTHTGGFTGYTFKDLTDEMPKIEEHWSKENITFDALYTGYIGNKQQIDTILSINKRLVKGPLIVDPVMGDKGKLYPAFDEEFVAEMRKLCCEADIILPNITEASFLTGTKYLGEKYTVYDIENLILKLKNIGVKNILLTGVSFEEGQLGVALYLEELGGIYYYFKQKIDAEYHGTGDVFASAFVGSLMKGLDYPTASRVATEFTVESILKTIDDKNHFYGVKFEEVIPMLESIIKQMT